VGKGGGIRTIGPPSLRWRSPGPARHPPGFIEPCLPTNGHTAPMGPQWVYEKQARRTPVVAAATEQAHTLAVAAADEPEAAGADEGIRLCEHIEGADGAVVFRAACNMGLEGIVAKRRDSRYRSGRTRDWIKIKNLAHPAIERTLLIALSKRGRPG